jgi:hypothetical protein
MARIERSEKKMLDAMNEYVKLCETVGAEGGEQFNCYEKDLSKKVSSVEDCLSRVGWLREVNS